MSESYKKVVRVLSGRREGMTRGEISKNTHISGGTLSTILKNLENSDFILSYRNFGMKKKDAIYRLTDFYTFFYFKFVENSDTSDNHYWEKFQNSPSVTIWQGFAFELVCLTHLAQIKKALGIAAVSTEASSWRSDDKYNAGEVSAKLKDKAQIDLVISRADRIINLCEIKFSKEEYSISKEYEDKLRRKMSVFRDATKTKYGIVLTLVTTYGLIPNIHSGIVQKQILLDDLFQTDE